MRCDVPAWTEDEEVAKGHSWSLRFGRQDAEYGGVDVVLGNTADVDKFLQGILKVEQISEIQHKNCGNFIPCTAHS
jgi:hypothetical protein